MTLFDQRIVELIDEHVPASDLDDIERGHVGSSDLVDIEVESKLVVASQLRMMHCLPSSCIHSGARHSCDRPRGIVTTRSVRIS